MWSKCRIKQIVLMLCGSLALTLAADEQLLSEEDCPSTTNYLCENGRRCIIKAYVCNNFEDCPNGDDEKDCDLKFCKPEKYFKCRTGDQCIDKGLTCDNVADCADASDESDTMCDGNYTDERKPCNLNKEFECEAKICIPKRKVCDGTKNCMDGSDEEPKMCQSFNKTCSGFRCDNGQCLSMHSWYCDGRKDCNDGSDEAHCHPECTAAHGKFLCADGVECIEIEKVCDDKDDCRDKSDESSSCAKKDSCDALKCDGPCDLLPTGPKCQCDQGFKYNEKTKQCDDMDECSHFGVCSQGCVNTNGSHYCTCAKNFRMKNDNKTCMAYGKDPILVYTTGRKIKIIHLHAQVTEVVQKTRQPVGVTFDGDSFYWTEIAYGRESIMKWSYGAANAETILTAGVEHPEDIAIDWLTGNIYFTDASRTHIAVCTGNGYHCTQIVYPENKNIGRYEGYTTVIDKPRAITLYPPEALMFWTDWGKKAHIGVSMMDGQKPMVLVDDLTWPNGLALDWPSRRLYWADAHTGTIECVTITGKDRRKIMENQDYHPFGLAVFENRIYWSDWETKSIESADKFTGKDHEVVAQGQQIFDVHIFQQALMPRSNHACNAHECSHICLLAEDQKFTCACPENMELKADKMTCRDTEKRFNIILGVGSYYISIPHQTFGRHRNTVAEPFPKNIHRLAYNSLTGGAFFTYEDDTRLFMVDRYRKKFTEIVGDFVDHIDAMAFDYLANNLYWIDGHKGTLEVYSINTNKRTIVQHYNGTDKPRALALVPSLGEMFVGLKSIDHHHIDRQPMKGGQDHHHLIETGISKLGPIHFTVDEQRKRLYWSDGDEKAIESCNFDGTNRTLFILSTRSPGSLAVVDDELYWTSYGSKTLQWFDVENGKAIKKADIDRPSKSQDLPNLVHIVAGTPLKTSNHLCMKDNGGCSDICVSDGLTARSCLCQTGHVFKDKTETVCVKRSDCGFKCSKSLECLEMSQRCNSKIDCLDGSDEANCDDDKKLKCDASQFKCKDGLKCIPQSQRCDLHFNCRDKSDEENCSQREKEQHCKAHQMRCSNGLCLDVSQRCDGHDDCGDGSDELPSVCESTKCPSDYFKCTSGQCFPKEFECNGFIDCLDASDEHAECTNQICKPPMRPCRSGWCISGQLFCDGHEDCEDGFDELGCKKENPDSTCDIDEVPCKSNTSICIDKSNVCNHFPDCPKGEDEKNCPHCPPDTFECANDNCVIHRWVCDGNDDCLDGSDELNCGKPEAARVSKNCESDEFKCFDGSCISYDKVCDGERNCDGGDDEGGMCSSACKSISCEQKCVATPKGAFCTCDEGFRTVGAGDKTCKDIDECKEQNPCSQICENTIGSFRCLCHDEFLLASDKVTCKAFGETQSTLFIFDDQIRNFTEARRSTDILIKTDNFKILDFDLNMKQQKLWLAVAEDDEMIEIDLRTKEKSVIEGFPIVHRIAHDWISNNHYIVHFAEDLRVEIHVCSLKTKGCARINRFEPREHVSAIQVDPVNKLLFIIEISSKLFEKTKSRIIKMRLDGSDRKEIMNETHISDIALDIEQKMVYYTESESRSLKVISYDGGDSKVVTHQTRLIKYPISLSLFENNAYILNDLSSKMTQCKLYGDLECRQVDILAGNAKRIVIAQKSRQKIIENNCSENPCDVVCVPADVRFKCLCANGTSVALGIRCTTKESVDEEASGSFWLWTMFIIFFIAAVAGIWFYIYKRKPFRGAFNFNVVRFNRANELFCKAPRMDEKPKPLPRNVSSASAPSVNTLNRNCHEVINDDFSYYQSATKLNIPHSESDRLSLEENDEELDDVDISNDPHQRLIV